MSAINDLIGQIENLGPGERIQREVDKLAKQKKFGLMFEERLPECTPLYDAPVRKGSKAALKNRKANDFYTGLSIERGGQRRLHEAGRRNRRGAADCRIRYKNRLGAPSLRRMPPTRSFYLWSIRDSNP